MSTPPRPAARSRAGVSWRATVVTVAASAAVAATPLLPWATSGRRERSGFDLAQLARSLGLASSWPQRGLLVGVALLPLLAAVAWTAACLRLPAVVAAAGVASGAVALAGAVVVWRAPVDAGLGPLAGSVAGAVAMAGALALAATRGWRWTSSSP